MGFLKLPLLLWNVCEIFLSKTVLPGCCRGGLVNELLDEPRKLWSWLFHKFSGFEIKVLIIRLILTGKKVICIRRVSKDDSCTFRCLGWKIKEHHLSFCVILKKTWHRFSFQFWLTFFLSIGLHNHIMLNYTITYSWVIYLYSSNIWMTIVLWTLASNCARWRSLLKKTNHRHCHCVQYNLHLPINWLVIWLVIWLVRWLVRWLERY